MAYPCTSKAAVPYEALQSYIYVRCRRCENCLQARRHIWLVRAAREQITAKQTCFVTLTFNRKARAAILSRATELGEASPSARLVRASGWYVQTFMKRLRKAAFAGRYLWVPEPHLDGFPHWHGLLHAQRAFAVKQIMKKDKKTGAYRVAFVCPEIEAAWSAGWIDTELVRDIGAIRYITKYIAKGRYGRIRCSEAYGGDWLLDYQATGSSREAIARADQDALGEALKAAREGRSLQRREGGRKAEPQ